MLENIGLNLNEVDVLILAVYVRCIYIGIRRGLLVEVFKFLGAVFSTFISLHYYVKFAEIIHHNFRFPIIESNTIAFSLLWIVSFLVFKAARDGWLVIFHSDDQAKWSFAAGGMLAFFRASFISGLIFVLIFITGNEFLEKKSEDSFSSFYLRNFSPNVYELIFDGFLSKLFTGEEKNTTVMKLTQPRENDPIE